MTWHTTPPKGGMPDRIKLYSPGDRDNAVEYVPVDYMERAVADARWAERESITPCRPCPHNGVCATGGCVYKRGGQDGD
jgi:hypothetical protein